MNPFAAVAVKTVSAASAAALLSLGAAGVIAQAASPNPNTPTAAAGTKATRDAHADRRAVAKAVFEAEAKTLGLKPEELRKLLKDGAKVSDLANDRHMNKDQFAAALTKNLKPSLDTLVDKGTITRAQADKTLDRIAKGHIPFWNGVHHKKK
jgi:membrane-bound lytic murein transglycosylase B